MRLFRNKQQQKRDQNRQNGDEKRGYERGDHFFLIRMVIEVFAEDGEERRDFVDGDERHQCRDRDHPEEGERPYAEFHDPVSDEFAREGGAPYSVPVEISPVWCGFYYAC
jgi:hypothetical protein